MRARLQCVHIGLICRYSELVSEIGELQPLPNICLGPAKSALLNVYFEDQSWSYRFNLDSTATDVKRLLSRKFVKLPPGAFTLHFNDTQSHVGAEVMKYPQRTLRRYGAKDREEIYVRLTVSAYAPDNSV